jgi:tetratricopeptide (TPR) repeat protein
MSLPLNEASMSDTGLDARPAQNDCAYSAGSELERAVDAAQDLFDKSDLDGALKVLSLLEAKYISCAKLFDLLGDVLLRKGEVEAGIRYKTLHEILRGTFKIVTQHSENSAAAEPAYGEERPPATSDAEPQAPEFPITLAMANELMRQGLYDRAREVYDKLSKQDPDDRLLRQAKDKAGKKYVEKELMGILQTWLGNVDRMKLSRSGGI